MSKNPAFLHKLFKIVPYKWIRHNIYPLIMPSKKEEFNSEAYFDSWYSAVDEGNIDDGATISLDYNLALVQYHYKVVEMAILEFMYKNGIESMEGKAGLDIGSGAGHWIDFYLNELGAGSCDGIEISNVCAENLHNKYIDDDRVEIMHLDISKSAPGIDKKYDVINAIGVMFHIVNDKAWEQAIQNLTDMLNPGGMLIVGGQFDWATRNVQFHNTDSFEDKSALNSYNSIKQVFKKPDKVIRINKRIRSKSKWIKTARKCGLDYIDFIRSRENRSFTTPENNLLIFGKTGH